MHEENFSSIVARMFSPQIFIFRTFSKIAWNTTLLEPEALDEIYLSMPHLFVNEKNHIRNG